MLHCYHLFLVLHLFVSLSTFISDYAAAAPPHLHSFPTRRSSDLGSVASCAAHELTGPSPSTRLRMTAGGLRRSRALFLFFRDRKSTRLNSSHRWISYAVFCLRKKKLYQDKVVDFEFLLM